MGAKCKAQTYPELSVTPQRFLCGSKKNDQSFCHAIARLATWWTHCYCWLKNILQVIQLYTWKQIESMQRGRGTNLGSQPVTLKKSQHLWGGDKMHEKALSPDIPSAVLPGLLSGILPSLFSRTHIFALHPSRAKGSKKKTNKDQKNKIEGSKKKNKDQKKTNKDDHSENRPETAEKEDQKKQLGIHMNKNERE